MIQLRLPPFLLKTYSCSRPFLENWHWTSLDVVLVPNGWHPSLQALHRTWPLGFLLLPCQQSEKKVIAMTLPCPLKRLPVLKLYKGVTLALERAVQPLYKGAATLSLATPLHAVAMEAMEAMPMEVRTNLPRGLPAEARTSQGAPGLAETRVQIQCSLATSEMTGDLHQKHQISAAGLNLYAPTRVACLVMGCVVASPVAANLWLNDFAVSPLVNHYLRTLCCQGSL